MSKIDHLHIFRVKVFFLILIIFAVFLQKDTVYAFDYYPLYYLRTSYSPVARGIGRCEINLADEYTSMSNPGGLGLFHLNKRVSISFPARYKWDSESSPEIEQKSHSISIGFPLTIKDEHFGLGIAYSDIESDFSWREYIHYNIIAYIEKTDCFSLGAAYYNKARFGVGYTWKRIDS